MGRWRRQPKTKEEMAERAEDRHTGGQTCGRLTTHSLVLLILPPVFQRRLDDTQKERVDRLGRGDDAKQTK